jgi:inosose dehydratase
LVGLTNSIHLRRTAARAESLDKAISLGTRMIGCTVGLLLDTGHLAFAGADRYRMAASAANQSCPLQGCPPRCAGACSRHRESFLDAVLDGVFTMPGDGAINFALTALKVADYRDWLVVEAEQDPAEAPPLVYARSGFAHLSAAVHDTGW